MCGYYLFFIVLTLTLHFQECLSTPSPIWNTATTIDNLKLTEESATQTLTSLNPTIEYETTTKNDTKIENKTTQNVEEAATMQDLTTTRIVDVATTQSLPTSQKEIAAVPTAQDISNVNFFKEDKTLCQQLAGNFDQLTQTRFASLLTEDCRYDKLTKPSTNRNDVTDVTFQIDIRHIEAMEQLQFKMHILVQYKYTDSRLNYEHISPNRGNMLGEDSLRSLIWIPHLVLSNERDTSIMGLEGKDVFVSISPKGEIIYSYRMTAMIYCWMDLLYFPFDEQTCNLHFMSWTYNSSQLVLKWDEEEPAKVPSQLHLTEFRLLEYHTKETVTPAALKKGAFSGNYSTLVFEFKVSREIGYYLMDYFIPSIMLVATSWVTFWLQADNAAPRVALGTSTMLSFITLASGQSKNLPKVSYIKVSEIWFLVCSFFIFASMVEFAFVNIIWRRKKKVELKKVNSKYIFKSTLTPRLARKELERSASGRLYKTRSCGSLTGSAVNGSTEKMYNNYLTVNCPRDIHNIPKITMQSDEMILKVDSDTTIDMQEPQNDKAASGGWTTMTPQEVAIWIDKRSRICFPAMFILFNAVFWTVVLTV